MSRVKVMLFFFITGLAFLFVEIAFIQRFILFLYHPVYAITVCLAAFLVFAGLGSRCSLPLADTFSPFRVLITAVMAVALLSTFYLVSLDWIFTVTGSLPMPVKILVTTLLIGPLAISMGMPFPLAM